MVLNAIFFFFSYVCMDIIGIQKRSTVGLCYVIVGQARANVILKCISVNASLLGTGIIDAGTQFPEGVA